MASQCNAQVMILADPYLISDSVPHLSGWTAYVGDRAAILIQKHIRHKITRKMKNLVLLQIGDLRILSIYVPNRMSLEDDLDRLSDFLANTSTTAPVIIAGDFNVRSRIVQPSCATSAHQEAFDDFILDYSLAVANCDTATREYNGVRSIHDYTLSRNVLVRKWRTDEYTNLSDHFPITFTASKMVPEAPVYPKIDLEAFEELIKTPPTLLPYDSVDAVRRNVGKIITRCSINPKVSELMLFPTLWFRCTLCTVSCNST